MHFKPFTERLGQHTTEAHCQLSGSPQREFGVATERKKGDMNLQFGLVLPRVNPVCFSSLQDGGQHKEPASLDVLDISPTTAVMFVASSSAILLLVFFFLNKVFFFILVSLNNPF